MNKLNLMDIFPFVWPKCKQARGEEIERVKQDLQLILQDNPQKHEIINHAFQYLAQHSPYIDVVESFQSSGSVRHPAYELLKYLSTFSENTITQVVRKVNLNDLNSDSDETDFTYIDPYEEQKKLFSLKMMKHVSFPKLQKLLSDIYRLELETKLYSWINQISFVDYVKVSISTIKKALSLEFLDELTINTVIQCAKFQSQQENNCLQDTHKIIKLKQILNKISNFQKIDIKILLTQQPNELSPIQECIWTRQQVIQCIILFCLIQCEQTIQSSYFQHIEPISFCTEDISWNEQGFSQIRDYFPKLAKKMNKRYKILKEIPLFDSKINNQIFIYAQSHLGYYQHHINYDNFQLEDNLKKQIQLIMQNQYYDKNLALLILLANAKMFVQLLNALK